MKFYYLEKGKSVLEKTKLISLIRLMAIFLIALTFYNKIHPTAYLAT